MPKMKSIKPETVGGRLRAARKNKRLTLAKVGKHVGVSAQAVAQWEYGEAEPSLDKLRILVRLLEFEVADILGMPKRRNSDLDELSKRLEQILEILPTARPVIVDTSVSKPAMDGIYLVRLAKDDRRAVLGRVVWPQQIDGDKIQDNVENRRVAKNVNGESGSG